MNQRQCLKFLLIFLISFSVFSTGCSPRGIIAPDNGEASETIPSDDQLQGGTEAGNPPSSLRLVTGSVPSASEAASLNIDNPTLEVSVPCLADSVLVMTLPDGEEMAFQITETCSFTLLLDSGQAYTVSFASGEEIIADLLVENSPSESSPVFLVGEGEDALDLGEIAIDNNTETATPENNPALQNDFDGDGTVDYDDADSDGDEVMDKDESDCDKDGIPDDIDSDSECLTSLTTTTGLNLNNCTFQSSSDQKDFDSDGIPDTCDDDQDGDNVVDVEDNCPNLFNPGQKDLDQNGIGNKCDMDGNY